MNANGRKTNSKAERLLVFMLFALSLFILSSVSSAALPGGPTVTILSNTTKNNIGGSIVNSTANGTTPGAYIFTTAITSLQQNTGWKAYVGNVTGTLTLDDASGNTLFQWTLASIAGEVYATRASGTINWSGINCTWAGEGVSGYLQSTRQVEELENAALSQANPDDNISATFTQTNHSSITVGNIVIGKNECFALQTWQKDNQQTFADSDSANFTEVLLYDGTNTTNGNVIYETKIEQSIPGYNGNELYDFQMLVPENGADVYSSSTAYYFYVELS